MSKAYLYAGSNNNGRMENKVNITKSQSEKYKIGDKIIELYKNERNDWYANQIMVIIGTPKKSNINIPGDKGKAHDYEVSVRTLIESKKEFVKYHKKIHPDIFVTSTYKTKTKSLKTIYKEYNLKSDLNLLVLDLQGVELLALTGLGDLINDFNYIYTEINEEEIYEDCCKLNDIDSYLTKYGFEKKYLMVLNGYGNAFYIKR